MENISGAMAIAASVMIGVLLFGALLYMRDEIGFFKGTQNEAELIKQNKEFNSKYEAYNKTFMYGTDIISVVGMAADNNKKYTDEFSDSKEEAEAYYIEIDVKIGNEPLKNRTIQYDLDTDKNTWVRIYDASARLRVSDLYKGGDSEVLPAKQEFSLVGLFNALKNAGNSYEPEEFEELLNISKSPTPEYFNSNLSYIMKYSWITDFKRRAFKCTGVEYNAITGRVNKMTFEEVPLESGGYNEF